QHLDRDQHAFLARNARVDADLVREIGRERDRCDFVDDHGTHDQPPARVCSMPGSARMREKPTASAAVHSPADSPYLPRLAAISECGDSTPATKTLPGRSTQRTVPVTRACEDASSASMSRAAGSSCLPSWTRSP